MFWETMLGLSTAVSVRLLDPGTQILSCRDRLPSSTSSAGLSIHIWDEFPPHLRVCFPRTFRRTEPQGTDALDRAFRKRGSNPYERGGGKANLPVALVIKYLLG